MGGYGLHYLHTISDRESRNMLPQEKMIMLYSPFLMMHVTYVYHFHPHEGNPEWGGVIRHYLDYADSAYTYPQLGHFLGPYLVTGIPFGPT